MMAIADKYLIPRQRKENGITEIKVDWVEDALNHYPELHSRGWC